MSGAEPLILGAVAGGAIDKENPMRGAIIGATGMNLLAGGLGTAAQAYAGSAGGVAGAGAGMNVAPNITTLANSTLANQGVASTLGTTANLTPAITKEVAATAPQNFKLFPNISNVAQGSLEGRTGVTGLKMLNNVPSGGLLATPESTQLNQLAQQAARNLLSPQQSGANVTSQVQPIRRGAIIQDEEEDEVGSLLQAKVVSPNRKRNTLRNRALII